MKLFGSSGIRTVFNRDLVELAFRVGLAVGRSYPNVVVGTDTRTSGDVIKHVTISGLLAAGAACHDARMLPTPSLAYITRQFDAGVMITASHNPPEYNGLKLLNPDGSSFYASQQAQIEGAIMKDSREVAPWREIKHSDSYNGAIEHHIDTIVANFPEKLKLKVVVDAGCAAASEVTPRLLEKLGCEVVALNCSPSGIFPHAIEPVEANLGDLKKAVKSSNADLGIAHDGDADRLMVVDDRGRYITGDDLLAIFIQAIGGKDIVTTLDGSMAIEEMGFRVRRTRIGDTYVSEELKKGGDFGGETSGAWIFPNMSLCPDGIYAAAQIVDIASRQRLSELVDSLPHYPLLRGNVNSDGIVLSRLESNLMALEPIEVSHIDGIKLNFKDGWLLVRASGTEPKIRLTAEAKNEARVHQLYDEGIKAVKNSVNIRRKAA